MGTSKTIAVKVTRKMHAILAEGADRAGISIAEFTDRVLQAKTQGKLPIVDMAAELGEPLTDKGKVVGRVAIAKKNSNNRLLSPDGKWLFLPGLELWTTDQK